jgi:hypothetical protein
MRISLEAPGGSTLISIAIRWFRVPHIGPAPLRLPRIPGIYFLVGNFPRSDAFVCILGNAHMPSNALVFLAGVGTTFIILTAGFSGGLVLTKAAFDDRPEPPRADPGPPPRVRVILPAYAEPAPSATSVLDQSQTEVSAANPDVQLVREAPTPIAQVPKPDARTAERQLRVERRRQAERKARKVAAARAKQQIEAQTRQVPGIMAFGGDPPHFFGN